LISPPGYGGDTLRYYVEQATKVTTVKEPCFSTENIQFKANCVGPAFFNHNMVVQFSSLDQLYSYPFLKPFSVLYMKRDPVDALIRAWLAESKCVNRLRCGVHSRTPPFSEFALGYFDKIKNYEKEIRDTDYIQYEFMVGDLEDTLKSVFDMLQEHRDDLPPTPRLMHCLSRAPLQRSEDVSLELRAELCSSVAQALNLTCSK
jgi:hypothetical protein